MTRLNRTSADIASPAPVRTVHLGLGGFHRAHQAVYTNADPDWGIAAYTFRSTELPRLLTEQDGLYLLQVRGDDRTDTELIESISRAHPGGDTGRWLADLSSPDVSVLTLTITEAAYHVPADTEGSALAMVLDGLQQRYRCSGAPIALVPCDNLPRNGTVLRSALQHAAQDRDPGFAAWLDRDVSFVSTVVDRITPATTEQDLARAELGDLRDLATVVTEPFSEWLLDGDFPHGRPAWEKAGARFVGDLDAYQQRKLWLLNGAHSLLAYTGPALGCDTVDEAVQHPTIAALMQSWWDTAAHHLPLSQEELSEYQQRLQQRFASRGMRHNLRQIAVDGSQKLPARILPVLHAERAAGRIPDSATATLAGWLRHLRTGQVQDARADELVPLAQSPDAPRRVLNAVDPELAEDRELITAIEQDRFAA